MVTGNASFKMLCRNFGPFFFAELFKFSLIGRFSSLNSPFKVMPNHLDWTKPLQNLLSFSLFVFGAAGMFWIIVLLHSPSELELQGHELMVKPFLVETEIDCSINYNKSS